MTRLRDIPKMNYTLNRAYERVMSVLSPYPMNQPFSVLTMEVTTRCNSKCSFCAHNRIIKTGVRPNRDMDLSLAKKCIDWYARVPNIGVEKFIPTGLGETLLYPYITEVLEYSKKVWPDVETFANTNCINLEGAVADKMIDGAMDILTFSLCFIDKKDYETNMGTNNYDLVMRNMKDFLIMKGDRPPACKIHVFDRAENKRNLKKFVKEFSPFLNKNDSLSVKQLVDLLSVVEEPCEKWPCEEDEMVEFDSLLIDVEGNVVPCCSGLWKEDYRNLILANVLSDLPEVLPARTKEFRARPPNETCQHCIRLKRTKEYRREALECPVKKVR